jgi:SAM-dependent methyltransferase
MELPEVRGLERDSPQLVPIHRDIIQRKGFLKSLYREHYREFGRFLQGAPRGLAVEIGAGGGFIKEVLPEVVTTDLHPESHLDRVMRAERLDFPDESIAAILMLNVFHHLPDPRAFLREAERTLKTGGRIIMIEPAHTWLWRRLYPLLSAEPYDARSPDWGFTSAGRFTGANVPMAWIVFERDRERFQTEFPSLRLRDRRRHTAFLYLLSGGIWSRGLVPDGTYPFFFGVERLLTPVMPVIACQTTYVVEKTNPIRR